MSKVKVAAGSLVLSASLFVGWVTKEGWCATACIPVKGDVPTVGPGLTVRPDGSPVKMGDTITPVQGVQRTYAYLLAQDQKLKKSLGLVRISQEEYELYMDFAGQYGLNTLLKSTSWARLKAGDYVGACEGLLMYRKVKGYDCSTLVNGEPNKRCYGVWLRQKERHQRCLAAQ